LLHRVLLSSILHAGTVYRVSHRPVLEHLGCRIEVWLIAWVSERHGRERLHVLMRGHERVAVGVRILRGGLRISVVL
jgi:hypothetical protein